MWGQDDELQEDGTACAPPRHWWQVLGPGFITGASDDDPSGIGTYAAAGAMFGYATLWLAWACYPFIVAVQLICARIGRVSGKGLAGVLVGHYPKPVLYVAVTLLLVANTVNAGADIGAIAAAINLLVPLPILWLVPPITLVILAFQIYGSFAFIERTFKWLALTLLAYIGAAVLARPDWGAVLRATCVPTFHFEPKYISTLVAILGTTISPYLFFWQATEEVEEAKAEGPECRTESGIRRLLAERDLDVKLGMGFSQVVMYFIIFAAGATLYTTGHHEVSSATEAARALEPVAGRCAGLLFALGLIGTGLLAVPILTCASAFAIAEAAGWKRGLDLRARDARGFYAVIVVSMLVGMAINYLGINPMSALFWTAVSNGVLAPPLLVVIMLVSNNRAVMGKHTNTRWLNILGWGATGLMSLAVVGLFVTWGQ